MDTLRRLRDLPEYDTLTDAEHVAVLDASDLLDELRPLGYAFALAPDAALKVKPPTGADKDVRMRVAALAGAVVYCLHAEAASVLPDVCRTCGAPVERVSPSGVPYCTTHYRVAWAKALLRMADAGLARLAGTGDPEGRVA